MRSLTACFTGLPSKRTAATCAVIGSSTPAFWASVRAARAALRLAETAGVELPITAQVAAVLFEDKPVKQAVIDLMERALKSEQWA